MKYLQRSSIQVNTLLHHAWPHQAGEGCGRPGSNRVLASQHGHEEGGPEQGINTFEQHCFGVWIMKYMMIK